MSGGAPEELRTELAARVQNDLFDVSDKFTSKGEAFVQAMVQKILFNRTARLRKGRPTAERLQSP